MAKLDIQEKIRIGEYDLVWSYMLNLENDVNPNEDKKVSVQLWETIANEYVKPSDNVLAKGEKNTKTWC